MKYSPVNIIKYGIRHINGTFSSGRTKRLLGYPEDVILLIIHADDVGLSESENRASIEAMNQGMVTSGSIMVPCRGFQQIAEYSRSHPKADLGIHLTLTSEWNSYKWGPVLPGNEVPSIVNRDGYFFESAIELAKNFKVCDVKKELKAQIDLALRSGIDLTHIDTHMFTAFSHKEIQKIYIELGKEYRLPVLLNNEMSNGYLYRKTSVLVDSLYYARPKHNVQDLAEYYQGVLRSLKPGLNSILLHIAYNDNDMNSITGDQPKYGSEWRQTDFIFFTSMECRNILKERNIQLITWRDIRDRIIRQDITGIK